MKTIVLAVALLGVNAFASPEHEHAAPTVSPTFQNMKALVGTWEGIGKEAGAAQPMKVTYELTSGGTVLVEKLMPGTPEEMITVYANNGDQVNMIHYCMLGNQPQMKLKRADAHMFQFELDGIKGIASKNAEHMHALTITLDGKSLKHEWINYKDNKPGEIVAFEFTKRD